MNTPTPPAPQHRTHRQRRWLLGLAGAAVLAGLALACVVAVFDWNWARPWIREYVMSRSGRRFDFDDLRIHLDRHLNPTVEFRGITVENARWAADPQPLIKAARIAFTFEWRTLLSAVKVVDLIDIEGASVDMERQADGLRNWRLTRPDDRGPPHLQVIALRARDSQLHLIHRGIDLDVHARIERLPVLQASIGHPDLPLTQHLLATGTYKSHAFDVDTAVSDLLGFGATPEVFSLQGTAHVGDLKLAARGVTNDIHALGNLDVDATLTSSSGPALWPLPPALARVQPFAAQGHVSKIDVNWSVRQVTAHLGRHTELAGEVRFAGAPHSAQRHTLRAMLHDVVIDVDDLRSLAGQAPQASLGASTHATAAPAGGSRPLSAQPLALDRLRDLDADIDLHDARFTGAGPDIPQTMRLRATLKDGLLQLPAFDVGIAGGHVTGSAQLDASRSPAPLTLDARASGLKLEKLSARLAANPGIAAALNGHATLQSQGDSPRAFALGAHGSLTASLAPGATISRRLDAKLSLDGGAWLRSLFDSSAQVPVRCSLLTLAIAHGVATSRQFALETENTTLVGQGSFTFADESIDATLMPIRKQSALFALDKAIHAVGRPGALKISLVPPLDDEHGIQAGRSACR